MQGWKIVFFPERKNERKETKKNEEIEENSDAEEKEGAPGVQELAYLLARMARGKMPF